MKVRLDLALTVGVLILGICGFLLTVDNRLDSIDEQLEDIVEALERTAE